ncbi:hypothetical protein ACSMXN_10290 [Jatrophihabitans sp. DSM 45814]
MSNRTESGSAECNAERGQVIEILGDANQLPEWAPGFADSVRGDATSGWVITKAGREFSVSVDAHPEAGTVDYVREVAPGVLGGAYLRVIPRPGGGSVIVMTLPIASGAQPNEVKATLHDELTALVALADAG